MKTPTQAAKAAACPSSAPDTSTARAYAAAATERMASDGGISSELEWLRYHLNGIEYALKGMAQSGCVPDPFDIVALVQSAQDRVTGLIRAAEKANL